MVALYRGQAFRRGKGCSVRSLVERRFLTDSRYAGPLAGLEEAGLVASDRKPVSRSRPGFSSWWLTTLGRGTAEGLSNRYPHREPARPTVRLLETDGALAQALDERSRLEAAPRAVAEVVAVEPGAWTLEPRREDWRRGLGLLVLEGLLAGEVKVKKRSFLELLGPGDLLRPWTLRPELAPAQWEVLTLARFAVLDRELALRLAPWPEVTGLLLDRAVERSRSLAVQFALRQEGQVEERLRLALWHLARRWGEADGERVVLRVGPLSPHALGRMAATTPESAADALQLLQERGVVEPVEAGGWRLALAGRRTAPRPRGSPERRRQVDRGKELPDTAGVGRSLGGDRHPVATILIVDDEPDVRFLLKMVFEAAGHQIIQAHHGAAALERVGESRPDLIVTDVMMPILDGLELIERLRSDPETAATPILVLSSHARAVTGADAALAKPFRPHEVLATGLSLIESRG